ncbi:MAG: hypothetical protein OMM_06727 [Candidatus Magnetoglobus multicellularis str. Araruama]|uniref:Uncharacterized protein n=1 Tax=Candidatus Magnetoglobus multicellularis str. Araruama TaxID=890399 RepID=A0A1V1PGB9_9BACT|nr:MAG: hypothetical protein OMM_06727 [Candidatus Magnetoglobus multicellularis str. Araruama]
MKTNSKHIFFSATILALWLIISLSIIPCHMYNDPIRVKFNDNKYISSFENRNNVFNTYIFYDGALIEVGQLQKQNRHVCLFPYSSTIFSPSKYSSGYIIPNKINTLWKLQPLQIKEKLKT